MQAIPEWLGAYNLPSIGNMPIMIEAKGALLWSLLCGGFQSQNAKTCLCKSIYCTYNRFVSQKQMFSVFRFYMQHSLFRLYSCFLSCSQAMLACAENNVEKRKNNNNKCRQLKPSFHIHVSQYPFEIQYWLGCGFLSTWKCNANQPTTTTTTTPGGVLHTHKCTEQISYSQPNDISQQKILFCIDSRISGYWMIAKFMA